MIKPADSLAMFALVVGLICSSNSEAMRCGTQLVNEGENVSQMISACGEPTWNNGSTVFYKNKDSDGMNYTIHVGDSGLIDDIQFSRG